MDKSVEEHPGWWIDQIEKVVLNKEISETFGDVPNFPWILFSEKVSKALGDKQIEILPGKREWKKGTKVLVGMGKNPLILAAELTPLTGECFWILPSSDLTTISSLLLSQNAKTEGFSDPCLQREFIRFLLLYGLDAIKSLDGLEEMSPHLSNIALGSEGGLCTDVLLKIEGKKIWSRIILTTELQSSLENYFRGKWSILKPSPVHKSIFLDMRVTAGSTVLTQEQANMNEGDFLILEESSFSFFMSNSVANIEFDNSILFHVKLTSSGIKVLEYATYFLEESQPMEDDDDDVMDDNDGDNGDSDEADSSEQPQPEQLISPKEVPIQITVEIAKFKLSLDKVLKIRPGDTLAVRIPSGGVVRLVSHGKCIGKGEIIKVGDVTGVRVIDIG